MKEFILVFRADYRDMICVTDEGEMQERNIRWMRWIDDLIDKDHLSEGGNHLTPEGKVLRSHGVITNGPFRENKVSMMSYIQILAHSFDEAVEVARACPILTGEDTSVEVREICST